MNIALMRPEAIRPMQLPGCHVLLIVHDQQTRYALADLLLDAAFSLTLAATAETADMLLHTAAGFDVVVAEQELPGLPVAALLRLVQAGSPGLPVLLLDRMAAGLGLVTAVRDMVRRWPVARVNC